MLKKFYLVNFIFFSLLFFSNKILAQAFIQNAKFKHLSVNDGLSDNSISAILQDKEGFMWFGTTDGLNKYDGYKFIVYHHNPNDSNSIGPGAIYCIYEDMEGLIWIGSEGSLSVLDKKSNRFKVYKNQPNNPKSLSNNIVTDIIEDKKGKIWISTYGGGLNKFDKKTGNFFSYKNNPNNPFSISSDYVENCIPDSNGLIWIATFQETENKGGLNSFNEHSGEFTRYEHDQFDLLKDLYTKTDGMSPLIYRIIQDKKGTLWIANGSYFHGLSAFDKKEKKIIKQYKNDKKKKNSLSNNIVQCLFEDSKGNLWAGTINGLNILDKKTDEFAVFKNDHNNLNSLSNNYITKIYEDNQGLIWIGTSNGLNIYDMNNNNFIVFKNNSKDEKSLTNNLVFSIHEDSEEVIWLGTGAGGLTNFNKTTGEFNYFKGEVIKGGKKKPIGSISSIQETNGEQLWLGITSLVVLGFDRSSHTYNLAPSFVNEIGKNESTFILSLWVDSKKSLWVATPNGVFCNDFNKKERIHYINDPKNPNSISENFTFNIFGDSQDNIWLSTRSSGLNVLERTTGKFFCFKNNPQNSNSINNDVVNTIYQAPNGVLWLGTNGGGINALILQNGENKFTSGYRFYHFSDKDGLPNNVITAILPDDNGNLWLGTNQGLCKFTPPGYLSASPLNLTSDTSNPVLQNDKSIFKNYDLNDGLPSNSFSSAACKINNGCMYFGSTDGLLSFLPSNIKDNTHKPPVYFTSFKIFEKEFPLDTTIATKREITVSYQQNFFSFEFVALDYAQPSKNQYAFMMEGFDNEWIYIGNRRYASYTNLDPGEYVFRVKASNNSGIWNEKGASVRIIITPPFWRTKTFYAISIFTVFIIIFVYIKWRERNLMREKMILEDKVILRTKQLDEKNKVVEEQKKVVLEKNFQITESINYAKRIQNAILPPKELIKSFSSDSFIFFRPKDIVSGDFYYFKEFEKYTLLACVDCTGHGVPGGFMSTLGSLLLDKIADNEKLSPSEILNKLSDEIIRVLHQQNGGEIQDGMDLSICLIDRINHKIEFSGARNGIIVVKNEQAKRYKADPLPVGGSYMKKGIAIERNFKTQHIPINKNDWIYMYTDGFMEQVGGSEGIPMNYTQFENQLINVSKIESPDEKNKLLQMELDNWRGIHERDDDMLIMGFRIV